MLEQNNNEIEVLEEKPKKKISLPVIIAAVLCLVAFGLIIGGFLFSNKPKEEKPIEPAPKEELDPSIPDNLRDGLTENMKNFLNQIIEEQNGRNVLESVQYRILYTTMELDVAKQQSTGDTGQSVYYVDYDTFKNKYEELFGTNYNLDEDLAQNSPRGSREDCNGHPSVEGQNNVCWPMNLGIVGPRTYTLENQSGDDEKYLFEGKYQKDFPDGIKETGAFTITYTVDGNLAYLKSVSLKKD